METLDDFGEKMSSSAAAQDSGSVRDVSEIGSEYQSMSPLRYTTQYSRFASKREASQILPEDGAGETKDNQLISA